MDNHRLALWCWWQHLEESAQWHFLHVDRHYDSLWQSFNPWPKHSTPEHRRDLSAFRAATVSDGDGQFELYRWDTICSALWSLHADHLRDIRFATADEGDRPAIPHAQYVKPWALPGLLAHLAGSDESIASLPHIVDIDLDYFTRNDLDGAFGPVFSDAFVAEIARQLCTGLTNGRFGVVTIALSPETTGSWKLAERTLSHLLAPFADYRHFAAGAP